MGKKVTPKKGAPAWIVTFGDMMSLLLTFFILLVAMSEIDATKFKKVSGSLKQTFGVQRVEVFDDPPKGSSIMKDEHSGGASRSPVSINLSDSHLDSIKSVSEKNKQAAALEKQKRLDANLKKVFDRFEKEWRDGKIEIDKKDNDLILRISENAAFPEQKTQLQTGFEPMLNKLSDFVQDVQGQVMIVGHSDDKVIKTTKFKSNWEFSGARANTLAQALMQKGDVEPDRITVQFHGPTKPLVKNNSDINRRKNRRIEIIIKH